MSLLLDNFLVALPLFALVGAGWLTAALGLIEDDVGVALSKFSFAVALPALLFKLMCEVSQLPVPDWRVALAFFGACLVNFVFAQPIGRGLLGLVGAERAIFGVAAVFSNNIQLGVPLALALLGREAMPAVAVVFSLNDFIMWTLVTIAVELTRSERPRLLAAVGTGLWRTLRNPIIVGILLGLAWALTGWTLPKPIASAVDLVAASAAPVALFAVGMGLVRYRARANLTPSLVTVLLKLGLQPLLVYATCRLLGLGPVETGALCLLGCLPVGVNVYIMAERFAVLRGPVANALLITTALSAFTMPLIMSLLGLL